MPSCQDPHCHCNQPKSVPCIYCGGPTPMTGTKTCNFCYEVACRLEAFLRHPKGRAYALSLMPQRPEDKYDPSFGDEQECAGCGHPYERHFDTGDNMRPVGCKYCNCHRFQIGS